MITKKHKGLSTSLFLAVALQSACGGKKDSSDDSGSDTPATTTSGTTTTSTTTGGGTSTDTSAAMLQVFPSQLALSLFSDDESAALRLLVNTPSDEDEKAAIEAASRTPAKIAQESKERLKGQASSCVPDVLKRPPPMGRTEPCYEFDQDQIYGKRGSGGYSGNKNGMNSANEACMVAFAKSKVAVVNDLLERAKAMVETMLCQAKKSNPNITPPAANGESLDLKAAIAGAMSGRADEFEVAKLERIDVDGAAVYKSTIVSNHGGGKRTIVLVHSPDSSETYHGTLYTIHHADSAGAALRDQSELALNLPPNDGSFDRVLSIKYARIEDPASPGSYRVQGELVRARLDPALTDTALGSTGTLDLSAIRRLDVPESDQNYGKPVKNGQVVPQANDVVAGQTQIRFDLSEEGLGTTSYFENPGGNYNEAARGMVANVVKGNDGALKGCAISGAALGKNNLMQAYSIAKAQKLGQTLDPIGFYHPFFYVPQQAQQGCSLPSTGTDADGSYREVCSAGSPNYAKWYQPQISDTAVASEFVTQQVGGIITRQCYKLNDQGIWAIDDDEINEAAGYELVRNTATAKLITPPQLNDKVRPFGGEIGKKGP